MCHLSQIIELRDAGVVSVPDCLRAVMEILRTCVRVIRDRLSLHSAFETRQTQTSDLIRARFC